MFFPDSSGHPLNGDFEENYLQQLALEEFLGRKKETDLLEALMKKPEIIELPTERPAEPVSDFFMDRVKSLREKIGHINEEIETRFLLRDKFRQEIEYQISEAAFSLRQFHNFSVGVNIGIDQKRNHLERQLLTLRRDRRNVELRTWQDVISLRKELRGLIDEYKNALRRYRMVE
jgi:hypothetical protein